METPQITEGQSFTLMDIDGRELSWDGLVNCYSPGYSVTLPCSTTIVVGNAGNNFTMRDN